MEIDLTGEVRPCGRPTKAKNPCKQLTSHYAPGCRIHCTEDEARVAKALSEVHWEGWRRGLESAKNSSRQQVERLEAEIKKLRDAEDAARRVYRDFRGNQLVEVGRYAYCWIGTPDLVVGEDVILPASWVPGSSSWIGEVTALGSTYEGEHSTILGRVSPPVVAETSS